MTLDYREARPIDAGTRDPIQETPLRRFQILLDSVYHPEFTYEVLQEGTHYFLRVQGHGPDNMRPVSSPTYWYGRKWRLSPYMTDGEVVQTCLGATLAAVEHEHRERFRYKGVSVFDPHYDIDKLVELRGTPGALKERPHD